MIALAVGLSGMLGALARYGLDTLLERRRRGSWPLGTLVVNVVGSALIGAAYAAVRNSSLGGDSYSALTAGLAGGLTTFSSWSLATVVLWADGRRLAASANLALNIVLGLAACALGWSGAGALAGG